MACNYCGDVNSIILRSFPSESQSRICDACSHDVVMLPSDKLWSATTYQQCILARAMSFLADREITSLDVVKLPDPDVTGVRGGLRDLTQTNNRFRSLMRSPPKNWMPIFVSPSPHHHGQFSLVQYGHAFDYSYYDGTHRAMLARACGVDKVPVYVKKPALRTKQQSSSPYQTLIYRDGIVAGQRPDDRWPLLRGEHLEGKKVLDLAANSGVDGILNCVVSSEASYIGFDVDEQAVQDGNAVAESWGVANRAKLVSMDLYKHNGSFPKADVIFFFSCSKVISLEILKRAIVESGARRLYFETHNFHDDQSSVAVLAEPWNWQWLGSTVTVTGDAPRRRLWTAELRNP